MGVGNTLMRRLWDERWRLRGYVPFTNWNLVWRNRDKKSQSILDIGCGNGKPMRFFNRDGRYFSVGIDAFQPGLKHCQSVGSHSAFVLGDARSLPFREKSFDTILCLQVFEHFEKEEGELLLKQMERVARRQILITTDVGECVQRQSADGNTFQEHKYVWSIPELAGLGFRVFGMGVRGWGGETGVSHLFPAPLRWLVGNLLQLAVGPIVYFFPKYSGSALCVRDIGNETMNSGRA